VSSIQYCGVLCMLGGLQAQWRVPQRRGLQNGVYSVWLQLLCVSNTPLLGKRWFARAGQAAAVAQACMQSSQQETACTYM
jgi:hypothetical protein